MKRIKTKLLFVALVLILATTSCMTDPEGARDTLVKSGYTPIEVGGYDYFGGSESDVYITHFKAISPNGKDTVEGCVTRGWFKGSTVRLD